MNPFGQNVTRMVIERVLASQPYHGAFIESCTHHCTSCSSGGEDSWNGPRIKSTRSPDQVAYTEAAAFQRWYSDIQSDPSFRKYLYGNSDSRSRSGGGVEGSDVSISLNNNKTAKQTAGYRGRFDLSSYRHAYMQDGKYPCHHCCYCSA